MDPTSLSEPDTFTSLKLHQRRMTKRTKTRAKATKDTGQTYEAQRLKRIKENQALLAGLGIHVSTSAQRAQEKSKRPRRKRKPNALKQLKPCKPKKPERRSRRNLGLDPENVKGFANEAVKFIDETPVEDEEARDKRLLEKWQLHVKELESGESPVKGDSQRRLFLVPTGVPGVNDHTLKEPVASLQSYLWGFCEGLFARIFQKVRPGDVFLFTSSGCGEFNRIARVRETRVVRSCHSSQAKDIIQRKTFIGCVGYESRSRYVLVKNEV